MAERRWTVAAALALLALASRPAAAQDVARFAFPESGLALSRHAEAGSFFDVVGRRAAVFGYENRAAEVWAYPLKLVDDFRIVTTEKAIHVLNAPSPGATASLSISQGILEMAEKAFALQG